MHQLGRSFSTFFTACLILLATVHPSASARAQGDKPSSLSHKTVICSAEVQEQTLFHGPRQVTRYGFCEKDRAGQPVSWFVKPIFQTLEADHVNQLVYGVKFNHASDADPASYQQHGWVSSVVFNTDGTQRFEVSGRMGGYKRGLSDVVAGPNPALLGISVDRLQHISKPMAFALAATDAFVGYVAGFIRSTLMLPAPLYLDMERQTEDAKRVGFIDTQGKFVIPPQFRSHPNADFQAPHAAMRTADRKVGLMDTAGHWALEPTFERIEGWQNKGRDVWITVKRECGWIECLLHVTHFDQTTLKQVDTWDDTAYRWPLLNALKSDANHLGRDQEGLVRLLVSSIAAGSILLWPVMIWRQRRKQASWGQATLKGLALAVGWSSVAVIGTIILVIVVVLFLFAAGGANGSSTASNQGRSVFNTNRYDRNGNAIDVADTNHPDYHMNYSKKGSWN